MMLDANAIHAAQKELGKNGQNGDLIRADSARVIVNPMHGDFLTVNGNGETRETALSQSTAESSEVVEMAKPDNGKKPGNFDGKIGDESPDILLIDL